MLTSYWYGGKVEDASAEAAAVNRLFFIFLALFGVVNCLLLAIYRVIFVCHFGEGSASGLLALLLYGMRLDLALLGFEAALIILALGMWGGACPRRVLLGLWFLTGLHLFGCAGNFVSYAERSQSAGELLLPFITSPYQIYLAVMPFLRERWGFMILFVAVAGVFIWCGRRLAGRFSQEKIIQGRTLRSIALAMAVSLVLMLLSLEPVMRKVGSSLGTRHGWTGQITGAKYYMAFNHHALNQAVANPIYEFFRTELRGQLRSKVNYHFSEQEALGVWREATGRKEEDARFPLLTKVRGIPSSKIKNIIIVQVEGLSESLLNQEENGRFAMPFLRKLRGESFYCSNTFQNANFTSGGVFSTLTGIPKITYDQTIERFTSYEMKGAYGSLARILGTNDYSHYFCSGFRHNTDEFKAFASMQGCEALGYSYFKEALKGRNDVEDGLGILDAAFFEQCATMLLSGRTNHFTAHLMTGTTHSPWATPPGFPKPFKAAALNAFGYLDASVEMFFGRLKAAPAIWEETLIVVIGDHTSATFGKEFAERVRVPLIFYGASLPKRRDFGATWASQVDILPTILGFLKGEHWYAGMGRNLLDENLKPTGIVGGTVQLGYYIKDGYVLEYSPGADEMKMFVMEAATGRGDVSGKHVEEFARLRREYFAQVELAKRLSAAQQIFPWSAKDLINAPAAVAVR